MIFCMIRKEGKNVVSKGIMISMSVIEARVLTGREKTTRVTSCLTLGEVLLSNVIINFVVFVIKMIEIVSRNCAHAIGIMSRSGAYVEDLFDNDA